MHFQIFCVSDLDFWSTFFNYGNSFLKCIVRCFRFGFLEHIFEFQIFFFGMYFQILCSGFGFLDAFSNFVFWIFFPRMYYLNSGFSNPKQRLILENLKDDRMQVKSDMVSEELRKINISSIIFIKKRYNHNKVYKLVFY